MEQYLRRFFQASEHKDPSPYKDFNRGIDKWIKSSFKSWETGIDACNTNKMGNIQNKKPCPT